VTKITVQNSHFVRIECPRCLETYVLHSRLRYDEDDTGLDVYTESEWSQIKKQQGWEDEDIEWTKEAPKEKFDHRTWIKWMLDHKRITEETYREWMTTGFDSDYDGIEF
jgi:hypothetical protein